MMFRSFVAKSSIVIVAALLAVVVAASPARVSADQEAGNGGLRAAHLAALEWREIGPALTSGRIADIAGVADAPDTLYVATATGGAWKTTNRGVTWQAVFENGGTASLGSVSVAPSNPNVVWLGSGETWNWRSVSWGDGVYKSEDGGRSWTHMGLETTQHVGRIRDSSGGSRRRLRGGARRPVGVERGSRCVQDHRRRRQLGQGALRQRLHRRGRPGHGSARPRSPLCGRVSARASQLELSRRRPGERLYRSTDGGGHLEARWRAAFPRAMPARSACRSVASRPDVVYAAVSARPGDEGLYRSDDRGASWEHAHVRVSDTPKSVATPTTPTASTCSVTATTVSDDGGRTFRRRRHGRHACTSITTRCGSIRPTRDHMVIGNDGGLYLTRDRGRAWRLRRQPAGDAVLHGRRSTCRSPSTTSTAARRTTTRSAAPAARATPTASSTTTGT